MSAVLEGEFNRKLKKALVARLPGCVVIKHSDVYTGGVPDFSISDGPKTLWLEVKREDNVCTALQMNTLMRFGDAALELVFEMDGKRGKLLSKQNSACVDAAFDDLVGIIANMVRNA